MSKLKIFMAITAEGPIEWENRWEANVKDMANSLYRNGITYDENIIKWDESDIFYDFHELDGSDIRCIKCFEMIDFDQWISFLDDQCISTQYQCDTMGIFTGCGLIPAKNIEMYNYPNCFVSMYICPFYDDEIPSESSFNRFFRMIERNDPYDIGNWIDDKNRYNTYNETEVN